MQILTADGKILTVYSDNIDEKTMDCYEGEWDAESTVTINIPYSDIMDVISD
jgi:hypothetical protein